MQIALSDAKDGLSGLVERAEREHETFEITRYGKPVAVLMSADALESLYETLYWLSEPGTREAVAEVRQIIATGEGGYSADEMRARIDARK
jgi:prevent-host-death family protein